MSWFTHSMLTRALSKHPELGCVPHPMLDLVRECFDRVPEASGWEKTIEPYNLRDRVVLISGGTDSFVAYKWAKALTEELEVPGPLGLYVAFQTPYVSRELEAIQDLYEDDVVILDLMPLQVDQRQDSWGHIIPFRNLICIQAAAEITKPSGEIWLTALDGELRGDKSIPFMMECQRQLNRRVMTPFPTLTKADVVVKALKEGLTTETELLRTVTCFEEVSEDFTHCGKCRACLRKYLALIWGGFRHVDLIGPFTRFPKTFQRSPLYYAADEADRYREVMSEALRTRNFNDYSERRCVQDLTVMGYPSMTYRIEQVGGVVDPYEYEKYREILLRRVNRPGHEAELNVEEV